MIVLISGQRNGTTDDLYEERAEVNMLLLLPSSTPVFAGFPHRWSPCFSNVWAPQSSRSTKATRERWVMFKKKKSQLNLDASLAAFCCVCDAAGRGRACWKNFKVSIWQDGSAGYNETLASFKSFTVPGLISPEAARISAEFREWEHRRMGWKLESNL